MSRRQQLASMQSMLEHVAQEAASSGLGLIATLSAAAGEAAREELIAFDRRNRKSDETDEHSTRRTPEKADIFA